MFCREQEKAEVKDQKVLEILKEKDNNIKILQEVSFVDPCSLTVFNVANSILFLLIAYTMCNLSVLRLLQILKFN